MAVTSYLQWVHTLTWKRADMSWKTATLGSFGWKKRPVAMILILQEQDLCTFAEETMNKAFERGHPHSTTKVH